MVAACVTVWCACSATMPTALPNAQRDAQLIGPVYYCIACPVRACMVVSLVRAFPTLTHEDLHEVVCEVTTCQVQTKDGVRQGIALVDGHGVGHTITAVQHDTCTTQLQEEV